MRIKVIPEDFRVEEQIDLPLDPHGGYTLYCVERRGVTTPEVETLLGECVAPLQALADREQAAWTRLR